MRLSIHCAIALTLLSLAFASPARAEDPCRLPPLLHQHKDAATIQNLEEAWTAAYLRGDTEFERCLLTPDFTEIVRSGEIKVLADELAFAAKNQGKNLAIPDQPKGAVLIHGNVAVAYDFSKATAPDGKPRVTRYADYYVWENNSWHAFFAQQTSVEIR
jgi:hypothetical protein